MSDPNRSLRPLNPFKARSTAAAILAVLSLVGPLLGGSLGGVLAEVAANADIIQSQTERAVDAINALIGIGSLAWFWLERRAPNFRLSFRRG